MNGFIAALARSGNRAAHGDLVVPVDALVQAAVAPDRAGLTKVGRAYQKHGSRPNTSFPLPRGDVAALNEAGRQIVIELLTDVGTTMWMHQVGRFGMVIDVIAPDGRGVRYDGGGGFIGFLEPPR